MIWRILLAGGAVLFWFMIGAMAAVFYGCPPPDPELEKWNPDLHGYDRSAPPWEVIPSPFLDAGTSTRADTR